MVASGRDFTNAVSETVNVGYGSLGEGLVSVSKLAVRIRSPTFHPPGVGKHARMGGRNGNVANSRRHPNRIDRNRHVIRQSVAELAVEPPSPAFDRSSVGKHAGMEALAGNLDDAGRESRYVDRGRLRGDRSAVSELAVCAVPPTFDRSGNRYGTTVGGTKRKAFCLFAEIYRHGNVRIRDAPVSKPSACAVSPAFDRS